MGKKPCCDKGEVKKGAWSREEDRILTDYIKTHGKGRWERLSKKAGLKRCGKSCRLRWRNYLRPDIKRGNISPEEEDLILRLHRLLGNRWSLIAGRLPGRTDNEIKNYWNTLYGKRLRDGKNKKLDISRSYTKVNMDATGVSQNTVKLSPVREKETSVSRAEFWASMLKCSEVDMKAQVSIPQGVELHDNCCFGIDSVESGPWQPFDWDTTMTCTNIQMENYQSNTALLSSFSHGEGVREDAADDPVLNYDFGIDDVFLSSLPSLADLMNYCNTAWQQSITTNL